MISPRDVPTAAIVLAGGSICFVTTASSPDVLFSRLAVYVQGRYGDMLWADGAQEVRALFDAGNVQGAVLRYFERTGERWDDERCELVKLSPGEYWVPDEETVTDA